MQSFCGYSLVHYNCGSMLYVPVNFLVEFQTESLPQILGLFLVHYHSKSIHCCPIQQNIQLLIKLLKHHSWARMENGYLDKIHGT